MGLSSVNPNTFASYLLTAAIFAFFFMVIDRRAWFRALMFGTLFALGLGVVLSLSRGVSLVSLLIVPLLLFALRRHISPWKAFLLFGAVVLCLLPLIPPQYYARIRMLVVDPELDVPLLMRHSFNKVALRLFAENPLLGLGPGGFSASFTSKEFRYIADTFGQWKMVHNLYLAVACHTGLVGLTLFGSVIWRAFSDLRFVASFNGNRDTVFTTRGAPVLEVVLAAFLINAFLLPAEHEKYMWVLFAVAAALARIHGRGAEPDSPAPEDAALWRSS
jgi:O-antigen ligase